MITLENALVMNVVVTRNGEKIVIPVARIFEDENDETGTLYARYPGGQVFRVLTQTNVVSYVLTHFDKLESEGTMQKIPVEIYSELAQSMSNNRLYCFMNRQAILLKNEEFCRLLCCKFNVAQNGITAVESLERRMEEDKIPAKLFEVVRKIQANTFINERAVNCLKAVLGYKSKYVPAKVSAILSEIGEVYTSSETRELFFDAMVVMNAETLKRRIIEVKQKCLGRNSRIFVQNELEGCEIAESDNIRSE